MAVSNRPTIAIAVRICIWIAESVAIIVPLRSTVPIYEGSVVAILIRTWGKRYVTVWIFVVIITT